MCEILEKIKRRGYWKVVIRPTRYEEGRLSLDECRQAVVDNVVFFRGWDYPHTKRSEITAGGTWVQHTTDWSHYVEWWRMTQSGQFVHLFGIQEDWDPEGFAAGYNDTEPGEALSVLNALFAIAEVFEFASRLATTPVLEDEAYVEISLTGLDGRTLIMLDPGRILSGGYTCDVNELSRNWTLSTEELLGRSRDHALDHARWLFERFNWQNVPLEVLEDDQEKLIEGRL